MSQNETSMLRALNRLSRWRVVLSGWQLGSRPVGDPECDAVAHHRAMTLIARAELSALVQYLAVKGIVDRDELHAFTEQEADALSLALARQFPGAQATDQGIEIEVSVFERTAATWRP